jgi:hypothetical protein
MIIGSYQRLNLIETDPPICLGTEKIKRVKTTKSLGLMLDETLSWNEQVNAITTKVNRGLNVLKRLREFLDLETLLITLACRPSVLNPSFSVFCFRRREMEFALAHRRLRLQRLSQNAIDCPPVP